MIVIILVFNFNDMCDEIDSTKSYEPTKYKRIDNEEYYDLRKDTNKEYDNKFINGSKIKLSNLCNKIYINNIYTHFDKKIEELSATYGKINNTKIIYRCKYNNGNGNGSEYISKEIKDIFNFASNENINKTKIVSKINIIFDRNNNDIKNILLKTTNNNNDDLYYKFDSNNSVKTGSKLWLKTDQRGNDNIINKCHEDDDEYSEDIEIISMSFESIVCQTIDNNNKKNKQIKFNDRDIELPRNSLNIYRNKRKYDNVDFRHQTGIKNTSDGYSKLYI